eukprot:403363093
MLEYQANYLVLQNENANKVTALPYLDEKIDESYKKQVNELILQEMKAMDSKKDYLEKLPMPQFKHLESEFVKSELERVSKGIKLDSLRDQKDYIITQIPSDISKVEEWKKSIDQANINFQYAENRRMNLELEKIYGKEIWMTHIKQVENQLSYTDNLNNKLSEEAERINKKRRFTQMNEYDNFFRLHSKAFSTLNKNIDLEQECLKLEKEVDQFKDEIIKVQKIDEEKYLKLKQQQIEQVHSEPQIV